MFSRLVYVTELLLRTREALSALLESDIVLALSPRGTDLITLQGITFVISPPQQVLCYQIRTAKSSKIRPAKAVEPTVGDIVCDKGIL